jgi:hypothetical protein
MNYKLAKQLKDSGFPQKDVNKDGGTLIVPQVNEIPEELRKQFIKEHPAVYKPILEGVIEELGEDFQELSRSVATGYDFVALSIRRKDKDELPIWVGGKTPLEAVCNLYIKLNENLIIKK